MKPADHYAEALYDLVSIRCKDVWHMPEARALVADIQADARRAFAEELIASYWRDARDYGLPRGDAHGEAVREWVRRRALLDATATTDGDRP